MTGDWEGLARRLAHARRLAGLSQQELADALSLGKSSVQKMERPTTVWAKVAPMHRLAAAYFGWTPESIEQVLAGGEPTRADGTGTPANAGQAQAAALDELTAGLSPRAIEALRGGSTLDTDVVSLSTADDPDGEVVLIAKSGAWDDLSPERRRLFMKRWAELQMEARRIFYEEEPSP